MTDPPAAKRQRKNEDGLLCPISLALPLDPVTAEDGQIYEREAIEDYIESKRGTRLVSPKTRGRMGKRLLPSPLIKSTIETMIENGAITGEPAQDWKNRFKQKKEMADLLKKAEDGNVGAMEVVASCYSNANKGVKMDDKMAYKWYEKARCAGSLKGMAKVGECLIGGFGGVTTDKLKGMMYLGMAAGSGSDFAAYALAIFLAEGRYGVPVDKVQAQRLLEKSLSASCVTKDMSDEAKQQAQEKLDELLGES